MNDFNVRLDSNLVKNHNFTTRIHYDFENVKDHLLNLLTYFTPMIDNATTDTQVKVLVNTREYTFTMDLLNITAVKVNYNNCVNIKEHKT